MDKKELRKKYIEIRKNISEESRKEQSDMIAKKLIGLIEENDFDSVFLYAPKEYETDVLGVFEACGGIPFCFPKCQNGSMDFYEVDDLNKLEKGSFDVMEPNGSCKAFEYSKDKKILIAVPGVAFDESGYRIGYGKGFYDRFFEEKKDCVFLKAGVCFRECFIKDVMHEANDVPVDFVLKA
ncbi:MAG: 5-formyltetrahydrofolate cyclo-ligase [Lachnospiraceae bacterium]|nr:5-formyltetrahydrofolate cyclo-ligase [Lachnospiraceae bacterium]